MLRKIMDNKIFKIVYGIIRTVVILCLLLYLGFVLVQRFTNNSDIMGYRVFTIATGSMEPVYKVNDVILVKTVDDSTFKVGDDVAYIGNRDSVKGMLVTHRIIRIEEINKETRYILKGVNNEYEDPSITADQILGKVMGKVYVVNFINHVVKNSFGFFFLIFCPLVLVIFLEIADAILDIKVEKEKLISSEKKDFSKYEARIENVIDAQDEVAGETFVRDDFKTNSVLEQDSIREDNLVLQKGNVRKENHLREDVKLDDLSIASVIDDKNEEFGDEDEEVI